MKFRRRNKSHQSTRDVDLGSTRAPVVRYYHPSDRRPASAQKPNKTGERAENSSSQNSSQSTLSVAGQHVFRWGGTLVIIFLFFANLTLAGPAVGVSSENKGSFRPEQEYLQGAQQIFSSSMMNRIKLTVNTRSFEKSMKQKFPEIAHATIIVPLAGRELQVLVELSEPFSRLLLAGNSQAVLSTDGRVLDSIEAQKATQSTFADLFQVSMPSVSAEAGQQIVTTQELQLMRLLQSEFDGSTPQRPLLSSIEFDAQKREMRVRFKGVSYFAKLTPEREAREQVGALVATIEDSSKQARQITEYIDVRVEDRVFIK